MKFQHLTNSRILIEAKPGAVLSNCIRECITQSIEFDTVIILVHNGRTFNINPEEIVSPIRIKGLDGEDKTVDDQLMDELKDVEEIEEDLNES